MPHLKDAMFGVDEPMLRRANLRVHEFKRASEPTPGYFCECARIGCGLTMVAVDPFEFADVLAMPDALLVAPGHEIPGAEIVRACPGYIIVRQTAEAR